MLGARPVRPQPTCDQEAVAKRARFFRAETTRTSCILVAAGTVGEGGMMKGSEKPKKMDKKAPQKTLKERRSEKRAAKKTGGTG